MIKMCATLEYFAGCEAMKSTFNVQYNAFFSKTARHPQITE